MSDVNLAALTPEEKIGQLFFIGLQGTKLEGENLQLLEDIKPGGVCFFARNIRDPQQTRQFAVEIRNALKTTPFISVDQEGGLVDRFRRIITPMPAPSKLRNAADAANLAKLSAEILRILGFNMNFAPVVDVIDEHRAKFSNGLYSRTFGINKEDVVEFAAAYLEELQNNGIIGCLKHFPGLGATEVDSHEELPTVKLTSDQIIAQDLFPYRQLIASQNVYCIMAAHAAFPNSDLQEYDRNGKLLPSSLSAAFIENLLRSQMRFDRLVLTDDLEMGAIVKNYGIGEACKMAFQAGEDMLTICANPDAVREGFRSILGAFEDGEISGERLNQSLQRISKVKNLLSKPADFDEERIKEISLKISELNKNLE